MSTTATQGTSIEVLAPYLPYGITMATPRGPAKLVGLNYGSYQCPVETLDGDARIEGGAILGGLVQYDYADCLPMLRSFADLCTPLADGTVPAVEVARVLLNDWAGEYSYRVAESKSPTGQNFAVHAFKLKPQIGEVLAFRLSFLPDWNWLLRVKWESTLYHLENIGQAIDYLRSQHFAVGLESHQYIRITN